jgi:hypothetical protein
MADERLREGSRGPTALDPAAKARHLRDRVRAGSLSESRVALGATLGDEACRLLAPEAPAGPGPEGWDRGLAGHGQEALLRVGLAAARLALLVMEVDHPDERRLHDVLEHVGRWLLEPSEALAMAAYEGALGANRPLPSPRDETAEPGSLKANLVAASLALDEALVEALQLDEQSMRDTGLIWYEIRWEGRAAHAARTVETLAVSICFPYAPEALPQRIGDVLRMAAEATQASAVQSAVRKEVVPWLLGDGDPVRSRESPGA